MRTYTSIVRCSTCQKVLGKATGIPQTQEDTVAAGEAATRVLVCPERGHMRNSNLRFDWELEPEGAPVSPHRRVSGPQGTAIGHAAPAPGTPMAGPQVLGNVMGRVEHAPDRPKATTFTKAGDPILSEDELAAEIAAYESIEANRPAEVLATDQPDDHAAELANLPPEAVAVPVAEGSNPNGMAPGGFTHAHEHRDELEGTETSELAQSLANGSPS